MTNSRFHRASGLRSPYFSRFFMYFCVARKVGGDTRRRVEGELQPAVGRLQRCAGASAAPDLENDNHGEVADGSADHDPVVAAEKVPALVGDGPVLGVLVIAHFQLAGRGRGGWMDGWVRRGEERGGGERKGMKRRPEVWGFPGQWCV